MNIAVLFEDALTDFQKYYGHQSKEITKAYNLFIQGRTKEAAFVIRTLHAKPLTATPNELILWAERINRTNMSLLGVK